MLNWIIYLSIWVPLIAVGQMKIIDSEPTVPEVSSQPVVETLSVVAVAEPVVDRSFDQLVKDLMDAKLGTSFIETLGSVGLLNCLPRGGSGLGLACFSCSQSMGLSRLDFLFVESEIGTGVCSLGKVSLLTPKADKDFSYYKQELVRSLEKSKALKKENHDTFYAFEGGEFVIDLRVKNQFSAISSSYKDFVSLTKESKSHKKDNLRIQTMQQLFANLDMSLYKSIRSRILSSTHQSVDWEKLSSTAINTAQGLDLAYDQNASLLKIRIYKSLRLEFFNESKYLKNYCRDQFFDSLFPMVLSDTDLSVSGLVGDESLKITEVEISGVKYNLVQLSDSIEIEILADESCELLKRVDKKMSERDQKTSSEVFCSQTLTNNLRDLKFYKQYFEKKDNNAEPFVRSFYTAQFLKIAEYEYFQQLKKLSSPSTNSEQAKIDSDLLSTKLAEVNDYMSDLESFQSYLSDVIDLRRSLISKGINPDPIAVECK
ncbi:MAG: hypothetical protein AB8E15_06055 [Bdellovibrionales bacterium]